jgi:hypothetical protein
MNVHPIFSTSVYAFRTSTEGVGRELTRRLVEESERDTGRPRGEGQSWESARTLHQRSEPCFVALLQLFAQTVHATLLEAGCGLPLSQSYKLVPEAWAVVSRRGEHVLVQAHPGAHFCALFYADAGDSASGALAFLNPSPRTSISGVDLSPALSQVAPESGFLLVFPAWLYHLHQPYFGDRPRVCIACTFVCQPDADPLGTAVGGLPAN